jgi:esterase/lipase superfamily enzyme
MVDILFITNRVQLAPNANGVPQFGDTPMPAANGLWCGTATVNAISANDPDAGTIAQIQGLNQGGPSQAQLDMITQSPNDVVIFVHGSDNPFDAAIPRAAYNWTWLNQVSRRPLDLIAFSWPSRDYASLINIFEDHTDYVADQRAATASAPHFGLFLDQLYALRARLGATRRLNLLCHSMGNYMLGAAVEAWFAGRQMPAGQLFDQVVLAAADESKTTFLGSNGKRLSNLKQMARGIAVYFNYNDVMMELSNIVNQYTPLGQQGAIGQSSTQLYPTAIYQFLDCSNTNDYVGPYTFDESHQYYRQSPTVRKDIAGALIGQPPTRYFYDASGNTFWLFPTPIPGLPANYLAQNQGVV